MRKLNFEVAERYFVERLLCLEIFGCISQYHLCLLAQSGKCEPM